MLEYAELKKVVNREISLVVYLFCVSKEMVCVLHLLTHSTPKLPSYKNQSIDLLWKSIDWFLYGRLVS